MNKAKIYALDNILWWDHSFAAIDDDNLQTIGP